MIPSLLQYDLIEKRRRPATDCSHMHTELTVQSLVHGTKKTINYKRRPFLTLFGLLQKLKVYLQRILPLLSTVQIKASTHYATFHTTG